MKCFLRSYSLLICLLLLLATRMLAQEDSTLYVSQAWGIAFGSADTTDDFLIYDACIPKFDSSLILVVGKSQKADAFELKRGKDSYFYRKDNHTDAFLACFSIRGEFLWSTYLPAPDSNHLNGFASCVSAFDSSFIVVANAYLITDSIERTRALLPVAQGDLCLFEFSRTGSLIRTATFSPRQENASTSRSYDYPYCPRIFSIEKNNGETFLLSGHCLMVPGRNSSHGAGFSCRFPLPADWNTTQLSMAERSYSQYSNLVEYWLNPNIWFVASFVHSVDLKPHLYSNLSSDPSSAPSNSNMKTSPERNSTASKAPAPFAGFSFPQGHNLQSKPLFVEYWRVYAHFNRRNNTDYFYASPISTLRQEGKNGNMYKGAKAFSGSVTNTCKMQDLILVQGLHCQNYLNGFFRENDSTAYPYSHDSAHLFPTTPSRLQTRNPNYTAVPFLMLYNNNLLTDGTLPDPEWAAFLNVDWLYQDLLSAIDLSTPQNYYLPSAPVLLTSGNRFFMIGNAKTIGPGSLRGVFQYGIPQENAHHQGFMTAFQLGCPPPLAHFLPTDRLCPEDSVELTLRPEYGSYLFAFDSVFLQNGSISVSSDSTKAWVKKPGNYHAFLVSRMDGCEDAQTDTVHVSSFDLESHGNRFLPQDSTLCAHLDLDLLLPQQATDEFRCFWLDRDSVVLPFGNDTNRFTINGLRGTDGFGANTDSRYPRFFQLALFHKVCPHVLFDTLLVYDQVKPTFELPFHDTIVCLNEPILLDSLHPFVYQPFYGFEWSDGKTGSDHSFSGTGIHILRFFVKEEFDICTYSPATDTLRIRWSDPALTLISIPEDTAFCEKLSITLDASVPYPSTRYSWQEGMLDDLFPPTEDSSLFTSPVLKIDRDVSYGLFLLDSLGCLNSRQINISEEDCSPKLAIPNVFTPNGDGVNDVWKFTQLEKCFQVDILVVDRKGFHVLHEKVSDAEDFSWNGCLKNGSRKLPDGPYFYLVSFKDAYGRKKVQSGSVTILGTEQ